MTSQDKYTCLKIELNGYGWYNLTYILYNVFNYIHRIETNNPDDDDVSIYFLLIGSNR